MERPYKIIATATGGAAPRAVEKSVLLDALHARLRIDDFHDYSNNGLQVDSTRQTVSKVVSGVDATLDFFEAAAARGADLAICHHGISWGDSLKRLTGLNFRFVRLLMERDLALWACHLPLDANESLGNNARICDALGLVDKAPFGRYKDQFIGFRGVLSEPLARDRFNALLEKRISPRIVAHPFGGDTIRTVGVVSGGAPELLSDAVEAGIDAYVTGETNLAALNLARQCGANMFACGHYATERFGIRAVGDWLAETFGVAHEFIDFDLPL